MFCSIDTGVISLTNRYVTWQIKNFSAVPLTVNSEIRSPQFVYDSNWYTLVIWPRGLIGCGSEEWFGVCLYKDGDHRSSDSVQFSIVNGQGTVKTCTVECSANNTFMEEKFMEWSDFHSIIHKVAPNGCLTMVCKLPMERREEERRQGK